MEEGIKRVGRPSPKLSLLCVFSVDLRGGSGRSSRCIFFIYSKEQ